MALVLVVEDLREAREGLRILLRRGGYDSVAVDGGWAALERLAAGAVDLILLDLSMPDVDGFEVLRRLPPPGETGRPPVVVFTALDDSDSVRRARELGADEYLVKGRVSWRQVLDRVRHHLPAGAEPMTPVSAPDQPPADVVEKTPGPAPGARAAAPEEPAPQTQTPPPESEAPGDPPGTADASGPASEPPPSPPGEAGGA